MAPALAFNETLVASPTAVSPLCQVLPTLVTLLSLCTNSSQFQLISNSSRDDSWLADASQPLQPSGGRLAAGQELTLDGNPIQADDSLRLSTDRGPPPCHLDAWNCTDDNGTLDEWPLLPDEAPRNETDEEREVRLHNERVNHVNMIKAYVLIGVVVIILLTCFKVVFQLFVTYSNDQSDKNDR